jgi:hypothetical protein
MFSVKGHVSLKSQMEQCQCREWVLKSAMELHQLLRHPQVLPKVINFSPVMQERHSETRRAGERSSWS